MISEGFAGYLDRLGIAPSGTPSTQELFALQRAHLERIPYENIGIQLGRPPGMEAEVSVRRFAAGQGGYCFHLNGGFAALLESLGYDVARHVGGVHQDPAGRGATGDHMALTVRVDGGDWFVDVGLGDGPHEPLPLRAGTYRQGPFTYRMEPSATEPDGWTFHNDGHGSFPVMEFRGGAAAPEDFADEHRRLSTAADSPFVTTFTALRRDPDTVHVLRGRVLLRIGAAGVEQRVVDAPDEWFGLLADAFRRDLGDLDAADRAALWERVSRAHEAWLESRRETAGRA
ncbi:arylamine N-acetyltransferase family protein [Streptomyces roseolilacinus]|uniref:Arylamine N-acetyltransferase n=1 Tax=Streptomyces roseolilacinus TaxID=66904 RepID=A0A918B0A2_9ACTN|nr:arylamine N-acetyltransferase [Streptomyces roseolilacinus]GGP95122.1 arylamine N-acetyltransferase [Streptomyces roseolilacinus]